MTATESEHHHRKGNLSSKLAQLRRYQKKKKKDGEFYKLDFKMQLHRFSGR